MVTIRLYGKLGDIIYTLAVIRQLAINLNQPVKVLLTPINMPSWKLTISAIDSLVPLLASQSYIESVDVVDKIQLGQAIDMQFWFVNRHSSANLPTSLLQFMRSPAIGKPAFSGFDTTDCFSTVWLETQSLANGAIVVNRTGRYPADDPLSTWRRILDERPKGILRFLGFENEYECFRNFTNENITHERTNNLSEVACVVAGASYILTNQSPVLAIAHAMRKPVSVEVSAELPDCIFRRHGAKYYGCDESIIAARGFNVFEG